MLVRIVKLSFKKENISSFEKVFEETKTQIREFDGCNLLELYQDKNNPNIFFTYSYWNNENDLENYRNSDFFKSVWSKTKVMFDAKPEAWSVSKKAILS
ncbi:putative quinol monooxygenase [Croceitalea vernalis]|uniref:Antibiotic biosynthesis monooxygenase family protein n=1 Tax=Croceitalea vernalis TaxID=3075599 RepID=A0ABU3BGK0_9FLAO|nr:antibiotic biosynthesis monooxygenase family protein [Croceitalea sp. P007]MDT0621269.1 antibiotic biosynthesis monooxygenase family protein [Croceitalea sp. P007]